jgi:hypothetical protein
VALVPLFPLLVISWGVWLVVSLRRVVSVPVCESGVGDSVPWS